MTNKKDESKDPPFEIEFTEEMLATVIKRMDPDLALNATLTALKDGTEEERKIALMKAFAEAAGIQADRLRQKSKQKKKND